MLDQRQRSWDLNQELGNGIPRRVSLAAPNACPSYTLVNMENSAVIALVNLAKSRFHQTHTKNERETNMVEDKALNE